MFLTEACSTWSRSPEPGNRPLVADATLGNADIISIITIITINNKLACNGGAGGMAEDSASAPSTLCKRPSWP